MIALFTPEKGRLVLQEVPEPKVLDPTDVVIKVTTAAICGSDLHIKERVIPRVEPSVILGHEYVGRIVEVGAAVRELKVGDRVIGGPAFWCGHCFYCRKGVPQYCLKGGVYGYSLNGSHAEYMRLLYAENCLVKVPDGVSDEEAVLIGDAFQTGFHGAKQADINPGDVVVVFGCGPIGIGAIISCFLFGPKEVIAVDVIPFRLRLAEEFGALAVDATKYDPIKVIRERTNGMGADAAIEATGSPLAFQNALRSVRRGGVVSVVGVFGKPVEFPIDRYSQYGITVKMGLGYLGWIVNLLELVQSKKIGLSRLITHTFSLQKAIEAYRVFETERQGCLKVVLKN